MVQTSTVAMPHKIEAVGYATISQFKNYPKAQQRLLAMRAAKLDAYRAIVEELYGTHLKGNTTIRDMVIENDSYRAYFDSMVRGIHLLSITPKGNDIYEAEVELRLSNRSTQCLNNMSASCTQNKAAVVSQYPLADFPESRLNCTPNCQGMAFPQVIYYAD
jgi:hypothetical protein